MIEDNPCLGLDIAPSAARATTGGMAIGASESGGARVGLELPVAEERP